MADVNWSMLRFYTRAMLIIGAICTLPAVLSGMWWQLLICWFVAWFGGCVLQAVGDVV